MKTKQEIETVYAELISKAEGQFEKNLLQKEMEMKLRHLEEGFDAEKEREKSNFTCINCSG